MLVLGLKEEPEKQSNVGDCSWLLAYWQTSEPSLVWGLTWALTAQGLGSSSKAQGFRKPFMSLKRVNSVLNICFQRSSLWPKSEDSKNSSLDSLQSPTSYESFISVWENCISRIFFSVPLLALLERLASVCHQDWLRLLPPQRFQWKTVPLQTPPTNRLTPPLCAAHNAHTGVLDCCGGCVGPSRCSQPMLTPDFLHTWLSFLQPLTASSQVKRQATKPWQSWKHLIFTVHYLTCISALLLIHSEWGSISILKESLIY